MPIKNRKISFWRRLRNRQEIVGDTRVWKNERINLDKVMYWTKKEGISFDVRSDERNDMVKEQENKNFHNTKRNWNSHHSSQEKPQRVGKVLYKMNR